MGELTQREIEILTQVAHGASNAQIAKKLFIKDTTIKTQLNPTYQQTSILNIVHMVLMIIMNGNIPLKKLEIHSCIITLMATAELPLKRF